MWLSRRKKLKLPVQPQSPIPESEPVLASSDAWMNAFSFINLQPFVFQLCSCTPKLDMLASASTHANENEDADTTPMCVVLQDGNLTLKCAECSIALNESAFHPHSHTFICILTHSPTYTERKRERFHCNYAHFTSLRCLVPPIDQTSRPRQSYHCKSKKYFLIMCGKLRT